MIVEALSRLKIIRMTFLGFILLILSLGITMNCLIIPRTFGRALVASGGPVINDPNLILKNINGELKYPTSMAFLGQNDILVLEKNDGTVQRIVNGQMLKKPLLQVTVDGNDERGMLGIAVAKNESRGITYVFLYYTEFKPTYHSTGITLGNRLYRYELDGENLVNPKLLLNLPTNPSPGHNGGKIKIGPDGNLYLTVGDIEGSLNGSSYETKAQNYEDGKDPDGRAGILRITQDGKPVGNGILGSTRTLNLYYAYGIKNSFGIDFDSDTGNLWDSENGPTYGDEINLVRPGFNSGWSKIQGIWTVNDKTGRIIGLASDNPPELVSFDGKGKYSQPEFTWKPTVAPTAITFLNSDKLGMEYKNQLFVGDIKFGNIYHFELNKDRTQLDLAGVLSDKVADSLEENKNIIFGHGFAGITDLTEGPDGNLYVLTYDSTNGTIYEISSRN